MHTHTDLEYRKQKRNDFYSSLVITTGSAYSSGDVLGGLVTVDNSATAVGPISESGLSSILSDVCVIDPSSQSPAVDLFFFNQLPVTAVADKTAFALSAADMKNCIGVVTVAGADYVAAGALSTIAAGSKQSNLGKVLKPASGTALYCIPVIRGAVTFSSASVSFRFKFA